MAVSGHLVVYMITMVQCLGYITNDYGLFDYIAPLTCLDSCGYPDVDTEKFLDTAPCPPIFNLSLICQHSHRLSCSEVAAILDRCIYKYDVGCDVVFSSLESCVCDFNMTCSALNDTYIKSCGWTEKDFYCNSRGSTFVVTVPHSVSLANITVAVFESSSTESEITDISSSNRIKPTVVLERTTPFIGGSRSNQRDACDVTCILIASLGATTVCLITALLLYKCHRRWKSRSKQDDSTPVSTLGYMDSKAKLQDTKESLPLSGSSIEKKKKGRQLVGPSFCDNHMGGIKVGRPCSGFYTHMIDRRRYEQFPCVDTSTDHLVWDVGFSPPIPLQTLTINLDTTPMAIRIPRPSLSSFKSDVSGNTHNLSDDFIGYNNPTYKESTH